MPWVSSRSSSSASASASRVSRTSGRASALLRRQLGLQQPQRHRDRDQPLLGAVVQVALDPAALGVGGVDQPRARRLELDQPGPQLGLQALVLQRQARRGAHRAHELGVVLEHRIVHQRGDRLAVAFDERRAAAAVVLGQPDRGAVAVDVAALGREPEGQLERGVAQRPGERLRAGRRRRPASPSSTTSPATLPRASRRCSNTYSTAIGTVAAR